VIGSFWASNNTCEICRAGDQSLRVNLVGMEGAQAELMRARRRHPGAPDIPADDLIPSFPAASDMLGTGWFGIIAAEAGPGKTIAVVGNGAVGLLGCEKPGPPGPLRSRKGQSTKSAICATGRFHTLWGFLRRRGPDNPKAPHRDHRVDVK
jgi:hypothetical protein